MTEKEEDCALEGFYYITQGYRKIPGDMCYGGVSSTMEPVKKACSSMAWLSSIFGSKSVFITAILAAALYYGWPIIEAIIIVLPLPGDSIEKVKSAAGAATGLVQGALSSNRGPPSGGPHMNSQYSSNLEQQPDAFLEDDDNSDEDIGKPMKGLDYDSDDKNDEELMGGMSSAPAHSELIDLGSSGTESTTPGPTQRRAAKIPKLSGPN